MAHQFDLNIALNKHYPLYVGTDIWSRFLIHCRSEYPSRKVFVIVDENVNKYHGGKIKEECRKYFNEVCFIEIAEGEQSKSTDVWSNVLNQVLANGIERTTPIVAAGGGVTGDLAGFVASSVLRGVPFIQMPTTLLAMVDSSVGGKTGVNHTKGKNLIGAYYQPRAVFAHMPFLKTLAEQEWINGLSEMIKYAAISDPALFDELKQAVNNGFTPNKQWQQLVYRCIKIKAEVVEADAHEAGKRAILNFGHTFGHALEKLADFETVSHGEAVFVGMLAAVYYSVQEGGDVQNNRLGAFKSLYHINLPDRRKIDLLTKAMYTDKKVKNEKLRLILLQKWGEPTIKKGDDKQLLKHAWKAAYQKLEQ